MRKQIVIVHNKMQKNYRYTISEPIGKNFDRDFHPELAPEEMLTLGVFGGRYMRDCKKEYPTNWFIHAKLHPQGKPGHDKKINYFGINASLSLSEWQKKGWIYKDDPRGWFEWYCRYYMGRRIPDEDTRQIKRWKNMRRHITSLQKNCMRGDTNCRKRQRQALLHWAYDSRKM